MGKYTVTQAQWKAVASLPKVSRDLNPEPSYHKGANRPVEQVSWNEMVEFCARLFQATGRNYRLPSEAEWEYACRAGTTTPFHFGETITPGLANYSHNNGGTTDVGRFPPNAFGLYEMHGNVWELCADPGHGNYIGAPSDGSVWEGDPKLFMARGSSWENIPWRCRSAYRSGVGPDHRKNNCGFRVAFSLARTP
jgi:formylglycine-generating enzyme required for sulfatase activity